MYWPDMDDQFYSIAMSFFVEAGHISTYEPEYFNLNTDQIILDKDKYDTASLDLFDNLSLLFVIRQCMFFSAELLSDRKHRSQAARDVHGLIHSLIEMDASVCVFHLGDEILISFMGYGCHCVLSDWYPIEDRDGLLAERLDISNVSTKGNYAYFRDLMYSLERDYYRIHEGKSIYPFFPIDCISKVDLGYLSADEVTRMLHDSLYKYHLEYGDDYVPYGASVDTSIPDITRDLYFMLHVPTETEENPFGDKVETDDEDDGFFSDNSPGDDDKKSLRKSSELLSDSASRALKPDSEYIWVGGELVRRCVTSAIPKYIWVNGELVRDKRKDNTQTYPVEKQKSMDPFALKIDTLTAVEHILSKTDKELDLFEIQEKTGIIELNGIVSALETLCKSGKAVRSWSSIRGGKWVYSLDPRQTKCITTEHQNMSFPYEKSRGGSHASTDLWKRWSAQRDLEDQTIEDEIIRALKNTEEPMNFDVLKQKSIILSEADTDVLNSLLYKLCIKHLVYRIWVQASRRYFYCLDTPATRQKILEDSQRQIKIQMMKKAVARKKEIEELAGFNRQDTGKKATLESKTSKKKNDDTIPGNFVSQHGNDKTPAFVLPKELINAPLRTVHAFIANITFPKSLEELSGYIDEGYYDIELLQHKDISWTVPHYARIGDVVFFMHARSAIQSIRMLCKQLENQTIYDRMKKELLQKWLEKGKKLYNRYGGKIFAIGRLSGNPVQEEAPGLGITHWSSRTYAKIDDVWHLRKPIDMDEFKSFLKVSRFGSITAVHEAEYKKLKDLILEKNQTNSPE